MYKRIRSSLRLTDCSLVTGSEQKYMYSPMLKLGWKVKGLSILKHTHSMKFYGEILNSLFYCGTPGTFHIIILEYQE